MFEVLGFWGLGLGNDESNKSIIIYTSEKTMCLKCGILIFMLR